MAKKKSQLDNLRTRFISRGLALAKTGIKTGRLAAEHALTTALSKKDEDGSRWTQYVLKQVQVLAEDLGQLKGSAMKVGQMLSMYGEHFLPKEANEILKTLQFRAPSLNWKAMEPVLKSEIGAEKLKELEVDPSPWASASIGQVHRARRVKDQTEIALKIQYPGVDGAIETDLKFLKTILSLGPLLPKGPRFDSIFQEVRSMLYREVDYRHEILATEQMGQWLSSDSRYLVPKVFPEYSSQRVIATEFLEGEPVDSPKVLGLSQERRNQIGRAFFELYIRELLQFRMVQTDPHIGNYRVKIDPHGKNDQLICLDFGAMREVPQNYLSQFRKVLVGALTHNPKLIEEGGRSLKLLLPDDPPELIQHYTELCFLIIEPFAEIKWSDSRYMDDQGLYDWSRSDLPKRVAKKGSEIVFGFHLRTPPQETVFLDRKMGGTFVFLSVIGAKLNMRPWLLKMLEAHADQAQGLAQSP